MVFLHIENKPSNMGEKRSIAELNKLMGVKNNKTFMLVFMEGCGPCNATRPEWKKLQNVLPADFLNRKDVTIVSVDHVMADNITHLNPKPSSFPTMRYITNSGRTSENYEDCDIANKDRQIDSFVKWMENKLGESDITHYKHSGVHTHHDHHKHSGHHNKRSSASKTRTYLGGRTKRRRGGKWSLKYKRSINCRKPRGFSQKQHCKYGRR
jgi:thiol-disulfide isomerase/thioredoxin